MTRFLLVAALFAGGCSDDVGGTGGGPDAIGFARIDEEILKPRCTFACHSGGEFAAGGLDLEVEPRAALVDQEATDPMCEGAGKRVVPFEPEQSLLYLKVAARLAGEAASCGDTMPPGPNEPPLEEDQVALIREWIEAGAPE